ncbi:MAG: hypothetical protein K5768_01650 [Firmicutes bacterium]|nr:hypothetical protein [Bacillota bacterium]
MSKYIFDEKVCLMKMHTGAAKSIYHTKLADTDVHEIKASSAYASNLILVDKNYELGQKIFRKIASLQDTDVSSRTYGCWPYYMEEPISKMDAPDYNMASFNAKEMIVTIYKAGEFFDEETKEIMRKSIESACRCIIKRNVGVGYTNVCIADSFITVAAGEMLGCDEFVEYGRKKLKGFYFYTKAHGDVLEYNSPCYSPMAINDLGDFFIYIKDKEILEYAEKSNCLFWKMIAEHFDYNTLQLNGPQERAYSDYVDINFLKVIGMGTGIDFTKHPKFSVYFKDEEDIYFKDTRVKPICPKEYIPYFNGEKYFNSVLRRVTDGCNYPYFGYAKAATTYKCDRYAVGTVNRSEFWNQHRPFLGYIYTEERDLCVRVRCLHDGYDFSSGAFHCVQYEGNILASINFSKNRGDTHINLDILKDTILSAEDLRIVFEIEGNTKGINYYYKDNGICFNINNTELRIMPFICEFGDAQIKKELNISEDKIQFSLVLYSGERKNIDLAAPEKAITAFTAEFMPSEGYVEPTYHETEEFMDIHWNAGGKELELKAPKKTLTYIRNMYEDVESIDGKEIVDLASN